MNTTAKVLAACAAAWVLLAGSAAAGDVSTPSTFTFVHGDLISGEP